MLHVFFNCKVSNLLECIRVFKDEFILPFKAGEALKKWQFFYVFSERLNHAPKLGTGGAWLSTNKFCYAQHKLLKHF